MRKSRNVRLKEKSLRVARLSGTFVFQLKMLQTFFKLDYNSASGLRLVES